MKRKDVDRSKLSPMMLQYLEIKDNYEDSIIFFRLGDFYEMFFEDALLCSRVLELTLTGKRAGLEEKIPMCGVPYHAVTTYIDNLIDKGYKVAICEQIEDPKSTKGMVKRDVIQVVTKGTRLDDNINSSDFNFLGSIYDFDYCYAISYSDISTGLVYATVIEKDTDKLIREIIKNEFKEIIVNDKVDRDIINKLRVNHNILITIRDNIIENNEYSYIYNELEDIRLITTIKHLLSYIIDTKKGKLSHLQKAIIVNEEEHLLFDNNTKRNLELVETLRNRERQYSLLWLLDKTKTAMGSRFLKYNIENPLRNKKDIERRYDFIETLGNEFIIREELIKQLDQVYDLERLTSRISYGNMNARDMLQLKSSFKVLPVIKSNLEKLNYDKQINTMDEVYLLLEKSINEDAPISLREGSLIKKGYNKELDEIKDISSGSKDFILKMELEERERTGIKSLKVGFNKVFGYYIEVSKSNVGLIKDEYQYDRKQTLANCERYITPLLKEKENIILSAEERIINLEYKLFMDIREVIKRYIEDIQDIAKVISEVDMLQSLSIVAEENKYVRPTINNEGNMEMIGCRHPVVEKVLQDGYVDNDIVLDNNINVLLITGPNMAGKSTYMRQTAITIIMAQIGSFVPCTSCNIPLFDKIFTRIGASDDLVSGESTFMVEMKEANFALKEATPYSLILFDELGRGTATYDGMSLAQAILEYIHDKIKAKTLFSTHYHELTSLENNLKHLKNVHVSAILEDNKLTFLHKVKDGPVDKSYGIHVAGIAKLPDSLINRALDILNIYEKQGLKQEVFTQTSLFDETSITTPKENPIIEELKKLDPLKMTPIDAINYLYKLKDKLK